MANVIHLKSDEKPPEGEDWALVAHDPDGQYIGSGSVASCDRPQTGSATFYTPYPAVEADRAVAIAKAVAWADKHGVPNVYVVSR